MKPRPVCLLLVLLMISTGVAAVTVASKKFTENVVLGEIATAVLHHAGVIAEHRRDLGGTRILFAALARGDIDVYPEYTGTLYNEIFAGAGVRDGETLRARLQQQGIGMTRPLGFNNTYVLGMERERARDLGVNRISDLVSHPQLRLRFSNEFMDRGDGWPGLRRLYELPQTDVAGMDHDLAYRGLASGDIDVIDLYSTDAEIDYYQLHRLVDDRGYFPEYKAIYLYRHSLQQQYPQAIAALQSLAGTIDAVRMAAMNRAVKIDRQSSTAVSAAFLQTQFAFESDRRPNERLQRFWKNSGDHLRLVLISLTAAILVAVPLGVIAARWPRAAQVILAVVGIVQTIPSLALLVFMIPLLGIGGPPAIAALFLYSLLPIVRNTYSGLHDIDPPLQESAIALGLPAAARMRLIELPLATRSILAGIKTSAVINVGTATLGALIGAGGYGQPILTGIRLDDVSLILEGAVPAAVLALLVQLLFDGIEWLLVPAVLRRSDPGNVDRP